MLPNIFAFGISALNVPETLGGVQTDKVVSTVLAALLSVLVTGAAIATIAAVFLNA